jgi:hypothetical protein
LAHRCCASGSRILRAHRLKLPFHLRELGDRYVKDEFRKHAAADARWASATDRQSPKAHSCIFPASSTIRARRP